MKFSCIFYLLNQETQRIIFGLRIIIVYSCVIYRHIKQVGKYWPKEARKLHLAQAKQQRRKNQSVGIQAVLEPDQVFSSHSNSSSANRNKKGLNNEESFNIIGQQHNSSPNSSCEIVMTQNVFEEEEKIYDNDVRNSKLQVQSSKMFGTKSPTRTQSTEPVLLSVTTV